MADDRDTTNHVTERTTIVHTDGGRSGGGGTIAAVILVLLVLLGLFLFRGQIFGAADNVKKVDVDISTNGS
jgi:hypothetical protein